MRHFYGQSGTVYSTSGVAAGRGGRGRFFRCLNHSAIGIKFLDDVAERAECLDRADLFSRWPSLPHTMLPLEAVSDTLGGSPVGYALPVAEGDPLGVVLNPPARLRAGRRMTHKDLIGVAASMADGMAEGHATGLTEGDVNPGNRIVSRVKTNGTFAVNRIDVDSSPIRGTTRDGRLVEFFCPVGQPEFIPPEAIGKNLRNVHRDWQSDVFGLAVLVWMLVKEGSHPFALRHRSGGPVPALSDSILTGWPFSQQQSLPPDVEPVDVGVPLGTFPTEIQNLFTRAFRDGHSDPAKRPTAREWADTLTSWEQQTANVSAGAKSYLATLWRLIGGRAALSAVARVVARLSGATPSVPPARGSPLSASKRWLFVSAGAAALALAACVGVWGAKFLPAAPTSRDAPAPTGLKNPPPDDLFDNVPIWDELHREGAAERRKSP